MKQRIYQNKISKEVKDLVWQMFMGPYLPNWKDKDGIVENSDSIIAKRVGLPRVTVTKLLADRSKEHNKNIGKERPVVNNSEIIDKL